MEQSRSRPPLRRRGRSYLFENRKAGRLIEHGHHKNLNMKLVFFTLILLTMTNTIFLPEAHAQSKDEQAVASAVENLRKALIDPDKTTLDGLVLDELTYGHSN